MLTAPFLGKCNTAHCPVPTKPIYCPAVISITTLSVPCQLSPHSSPVPRILRAEDEVSTNGCSSTDCCPHTPTKYVTAKCPGCVTGCVIPTHTVTETTGCPKATLHAS